MIQTKSDLSKDIDIETLLKNTPNAEEVTMGNLQAAASAQQTYYVKNVTTGLCVIIYDAKAKLGGMAHIMLPDSEFQQAQPSGLGKAVDMSQYQACYADIALPELWERLKALGATVEDSFCVLIGGSQLFTFGGGRGNPLNIGARNAITARTVLGRLGLKIKQTEVGGNRPRHAVFMLGDGRIFVEMKGGETLQIV
jgi:chemotaxis protein CheD